MPTADLIASKPMTVNEVMDVPLAEVRSARKIGPVTSDTDPNRGPRGRNAVLDIATTDHPFQSRALHFTSSVAHFSDLLIRPLPNSLQHALPVDSVD